MALKNKKTKKIDPIDLNQGITFDDIKDIEGLGKDLWTAIHREYVENTKFSYGYGDDQWNDYVLSIRKHSGRPSETFNFIPGLIRPLINIIRDNPPAINCYPISGSDANKKTAMHLAGVLRAIEFENKAQLTYCNALESAIRGGIGGWRILPKIVEHFESDDSDSDKIHFEISPILDMQNLMIDPSSVNPNFSDAEWVIIKSKISEKEYRRDYPEGVETGFNGLVEINELWIKEITITKSAMGKTIRKSRINHYIYDAQQILVKEFNYPGKRLPFAFVSGEKYNINGDVHFGSITHDVKSCQQSFNWLRSEAIASISTAPKAHWIMDRSAIGSAEELDAYLNASTNPDDILFKNSGSEVQEIKPPEAPTGYMELADKDIEVARIITGIYPSPDVQQESGSPISGISLKNQQQMEHLQNAHYVKSLENAVQLSGEIILDLLPHYWNNDDIKMSLGVDGSFNAVSMGPNQVEHAFNFDLAYTKFGVTISSGPSYASQKEALINSIFDMVKTDPQILGLLGDWLISAINIPGSEDLSDRFAVMLPQPVQELIAMQKGSGDNPEDQLKATVLKLMQAQNEVKQLNATLAQTTQALTHETNQLQSKQQELQMKAQMEQQKIASEMHMKAMELQSKEQTEAMWAKLDEMKEYLKAITDAKKVEARFAENEQKHQQTLVQTEQKTSHDIEKKVVDHALTPKPIPVPAS
jgi:hypothetical protein